MIRRKRSVLPGLAVAVVAVAAMLAPAGPAMASSPLGTGPVCDREVPYEICLSADGIKGDNVLGQYFSTGNKEKTTVAAALVCDGTDVVDGGNSGNCPFQEGSGMNAKYHADLIVQMYNTSENDLWYIGDVSGNSISQEPKGTGYMWVLAPISAGSNIYYLVNVGASGSISEPVFACANPGGGGWEILLRTQFAGGGQCEWATP